MSKCLGRRCPSKNKMKFQESKEIRDELFKDVKEGKEEFNIKRLNMKNHIQDIKKIPQDKVFGKEFHAIFKTNNGSKLAEFCGPGTNISTRVLRGDRGLGGKGHTDNLCLSHDLDYRRASTDEDLIKEHKIIITQKADKDLLENIKKDKTGFFVNQEKIKFAMRLKGLSESLNLISQDKYIGKNIDRKIKNAFDYSDDLFNEINKIDSGDFMKTLLKLPKKEFEEFFIDLHKQELTIKDIIKIN